MNEENSNCCNPTEELDPSLEMQAKAEEEITSLKEQLQVKEGQTEELFQRLQRLQQDFDNFRRRTQKEKEELVQTAEASLVETLLPVIDNFERAIQTSSGDEGAFREGIEMIIKQMQKILNDAGLEPVEAVGSIFDPNLHEAVMVAEEESCQENTVVEELQKGFLFAGKVLRPAAVKVSSKKTK